MSLVNLEELLRPISEAAAAGANLEYSPEFLALERLAQGKPERRMGNAVVPAEPPDARAVLESSVALLAQTKDLRVAVHATSALVTRGGLEGLHDGLGLIRGLLELFWPSVHPELDADEGGDPTMRITALAALVSPTMLSGVRALPFLRAPALGQLFLKDVEAGSVAGATLDPLLRAADVGELTASATWLNQSLAHLASIDAIFEQNTGSRGPDLSALVRTLRAGSLTLAPRMEELRASAQVTEAEQSNAALGVQASVPAAARSSSAEIASREDVIRALDKICAYYSHYEPSSPLPLLIQRCKRLVPMSFVEILSELAPSAVAQVEVIAGKLEE